MALRYMLWVLLLSASLMTSCRPTHQPAVGPVNLDIAAIRNEKEFRLSEIVDSIEYVKLETRPECLVSNASRVVGKNCIVLLNQDPPQVLLFERSGKFIRKIGRIGKGPGEYVYPFRIDLSPDEEKIIVFDTATNLFLQYTMEGTCIGSMKAPYFISGGPYFIDQHYVAFLQSPFGDSLHYPRVVAMNIETGEHKPVWFIDYRANPHGQSGDWLQNQFFRTEKGIVFKDALCDTTFLLSNDRTLKTLMVFKPFPNKARYYNMPREEMEAISSATPSCCLSDFYFIIGSNPNRFHMIYNTSTGEAFRLSRNSALMDSTDYPYGIVNDLDGSGLFWFWNGNIRQNMSSTLLQVVDLKELIKSDYFNRANLLSDIYRNRLRQLAAGSSENDNPIIRILHFK